MSGSHERAHAPCERTHRHSLIDTAPECPGLPPSDSLEEALEEECFTVEGTPKPELSSKVLGMRQLKRIARTVGTDGEIVRINGQRFMLSGKRLRSVAIPVSSRSAR